MVYVCNLCISTLQAALDLQFRCCSSLPSDDYRAQEMQEASMDDDDEAGVDDNRKSWLQSSMTRVGVHFRRIKFTTKSLLESESAPTFEDRSNEEKDKRPSSDDANSIDSEAQEDTGSVEEKRTDEVNSVEINSVVGSNSDDEYEVTSRKNLRSVSLDCTSLHPDASVTGPSSGNFDSVKNHSGKARKRMLGDLAARSYDDSFIVRGERKGGALVSGNSILRFAVFQIHSKPESRRTLRFASKPFATSRCTLELDRDFGRISVRSVFIHRVWSFQCDDIQSIQDVEGKQMAAIVRIIILDELFKSRRIIDFRFDQEQEREAFKYAVASYCAAKSVKLLTRTSENSKALNAKSTLDDSDKHSSFSSVEVRERGISSQLRSMRRNNHWIAGEFDAARAEVLLLTGPIGEMNDVSQLWGRVAGTVYITNYRVLFIPSERSYVPVHRSCDGAAAYVPFFDIVSVNVITTNSSRVKPFRSTSNGMAQLAGTMPSDMYVIHQSSTVLCISCKDVRVMQLVVVAPIDAVEETTRKLLKLIQARTDSSQRYQTIPRALAIATRERLKVEAFCRRNKDCITTVSNVDPDTACNNTMSEAVGSLDFESSGEHLQISGAFAFSYAARRLPWEKNGWDLFREEAEYKRQFGDQKDALPFLKVRYSDKLD